MTLLLQQTFEVSAVMMSEAIIQACIPQSSITIPYWVLVGSLCSHHYHALRPCSCVLDPFGSLNRSSRYASISAESATNTPRSLVRISLSLADPTL